MRVPLVLPDPCKGQEVRCPYSGTAFRVERCAPFAEEDWRTCAVPELMFQCLRLLEYEGRKRPMARLERLPVTTEGRSAGIPTCDLLREVVGNPFRPVTLSPQWLTRNGGAVPRIAEAVYNELRFGDMPVLADALEEAGCDNPDVLAHCRGPGPHVRGCWVLDLLLGKE